MPKSDLTYRTNTDEADTKTNDTSDVIENITQKVKSAPREEGQDVRDYIQKQDHLTIVKMSENLKRRLRQYMDIICKPL